MEHGQDLIQRAAGPMTRRRMLQAMAASGIGAFLAACGTSGTRSPSPSAAGSTGASAAPSARPSVGASATPGATATGAPSPADTPSPEPSAEPSAAPTRPAVTGGFRWANWVGYIDKEGGNRYPTLERFTAETGISVEYSNGGVDDNESFYTADLEGPLGAGQPTGWDLVVLTDWMVQRLVARGWLETIDTSWMTNYPQNLKEEYRNRAWDPDNTFCAPWQSGMTGLGFDRAITGDLDSIEAFWDPQWAGRMTYLTEMRDTVGLSALRLGFDPATLTQEQFDQALAEVKRAVDEGLTRQLTGNSYVEEMDFGNVVLAMAWSGDVQGLLVPDQEAGQDFQWVLPKEGGMLWTDNMAIPKGAPNKTQVELWIDFYYQPDVAAVVEAWVNYVCPVAGADAEMLALDPDLAQNIYIFPTPDMTARLRDFISTDLETAQRWEEAFADAIGL